VEAKTYRWFGHSKSDPRVYRTREEEEEWKKRDPIKRFAERLLSEGVATEEELKKIDEEVAKEIEEAYQFAVESPEPNVEDLAKYVYAEEGE
jgi:pyruvate dehydrogenase E1 component alpha subunit